MAGVGISGRSLRERSVADQTDAVTANSVIIPEARCGM